MISASSNTRPTEKWRKINGVVKGEIQWLTHEALIEFVYLHHFRCVHNKMYVVPTYFIQKGISYIVCKIAFLNLVPSLNNWNCGKN